MAAATVDEFKVELGVPFTITRIQLSALTSDQAEDVAHRGPSGCSPFLVLPVVTVGATSGDPVTGTWVKASDNTTNNTVRVTARVPAGGDIAGAKVTVMCFFAQTASAGLNPPS
jgi:hypothetical protein